jgi:hypothetical protein
MRIVIEGIGGEDFALLMKILERLEFENKPEVMVNFRKMLEPEHEIIWCENCKTATRPIHHCKKK